ncbi:MAG: alpha/beta hydrolase [Rhodospirillaceae bacterium]|nr:alpha/beta hydrolase [Rhodospirillaceae bacterium]
MKLIASTVVALSLATSLAQAQDAPARPGIDDKGTITGTGPMIVPTSDFLSPEAKAQLTARLRITGQPTIKDGIEAVRKGSDATAKASLDGWLKIHPAKIENTTIDGVRTDIVTPDSGIDPKNINRVLINAHMGGFTTGGRYGGQVESVPLAGRGKIKIIAIDYRMSPEYLFPAASEDMETVYRYALKTTKPENIGIYGCSAGGTLVAESMAWFVKKNLPLPGAIGIFCSGAMNTFWFGGDSGQLTSILNATPAGGPTRPANAPRGYFEGMNTNDPLITPGLFPEVLAKFPPTLVVTGTRDVAMSNALITHTKLLQAGVAAELFVQEGLGHGHFFAFPGTPESTVAYDVIWKFFDRNLKK